MRTIALALCAALVIGGGAGSARAQSLGNLRFRSIGPSISGGRLGDVAGTDRDPVLYYAGAAGGGVWKSMDGGLHWEPVIDEQDVAPIGAVAVDPTAAQYREARAIEAEYVRLSGQFGKVRDAIAGL